LPPRVAEATFAVDILLNAIYAQLLRNERAGAIYPTYCGEEIPLLQDIAIFVLTAVFCIVYKFRTPGLFTVKSSGPDTATFFGRNSGIIGLGLSE
jgi:hypothetical protein